MDNLLQLNFTWLTPEQSKNLPPLTYLLDNFIPRGGLVMLYGRSGSGKSFLALDWAAQVAEVAPVIYLLTEGQGGFPGRIVAWEAHHARPISQNLLLALQAVNLLDSQQVENLLVSAANVQPALIIFDTLVNCLPGADENSAKDMSRTIRACQRIQAETGAAVLLIHHKTKSGEWERGSSVLRGAMDVMVEVDEQGGLFTLACGKSKDAAPFPETCYRLQAVAESCVLVPTNRVEWRDHYKPLAGPEVAVLGVLAGEGFAGQGVQVPDIAEWLPTITDRTIYRALRTLKTRGLVAQEKARAPYTITEKGKTLHTHHQPSVVPSASSAREV